MEQLQVPTRRVAVEVRTAEGGCLRGDLFVTDTAYEHDIAAEVGRLLNDERRFVPLAPSGDVEEPSAISKRQILRVHLLAEGDLCLVPQHPELELDPFPCTAILSDGTQIEGGLLVDSPLSASRLLDKLNLAPRFISFVSDSGFDFIHAEQIVRVF